MAAEADPMVLVRLGKLLSGHLQMGTRPVPDWYEALLFGLNRYGTDGNQPRVAMVALEAALVAEGHDPAGAVVVIGSSYFRPAATVGFDAAVRRHTNALLAWWATATSEERARAIGNLLCVSSETLAPFLLLIADAVGRSATLEQEVHWALARSQRKFSDEIGAGCLDVWRRIAAEGDKPAERKQSLQLLWREGDDATRDWAWGTALADRSVVIRRLPQRWDPDRAALSTDRAEPPVARNAVEAAARQGMPRKMPKTSWLVKAGLPQLRWADGEPVPDVVWQWWAKTSIEARWVEPGTEMLAWAALLDQSSAHAFAAALLKAWIEEDVSDEKIVARAAKDAAEQKSRFPMVSATEQEIFEGLLKTYRSNPPFSASSSRGVLALVAAFGGPGIAEQVSQYLTRWGRVTQVMALIELSTWVDDDAAVQLLVTHPKVLGDPDFRKHATEQLWRLADRLGISSAEFADRAVSDAGLDAEGALRLSYGLRSFTAQLTDDLTWTVRDDAGKVRRGGLPAASTTDDADQVVAAKAELAQTKKVVRELVAAQTARLRELMVSDHAWTAAQWLPRFVGHPVMSRLAQRLVWIAEPGGTFRLLADRTLAGPDDEPFVLDDQATVRLAHSTRLTPDQRDAWWAHLDDHQVTGLFDQLGTEPVVLDDPDITVLTGRQGYVITAAELRKQAVVRGWQRGDLMRTQKGRDGVQEVRDPVTKMWVRHPEPVVRSYDKDYPTARITAQIRFVGTFFPEDFPDETPQATFDGLRFCRDNEPLPLREVPPAMIAECWADLVAIAAAGPDLDDPDAAVTR
ncbi:MAG: DUF4132 domain-containing protein [Micrococcales bacterium]|nr:DUF4132 domain-containing protein [Micrococcales bacterium]